MAGNDESTKRGAEEEEADDDRKTKERADEETDETRLLDLSFLHRSRLLKLRLADHATLLQLGQQLVSASGIVPHTLRLLLPRTPALLPFSSPHSSLTIAQIGISEDRVMRVMGALPEEVNEVSHEAGKAIERTIIGFSEEDQRAKKWKSGRSGASRGLPQGNYIFCDFRTLQLPGIVLNPPAGRALDIMHKLACDPGIVAIMNKHRWRVGVMTEMAPLGYVGISPKCILGYNKNQGEEISLRLRTDDLKGFRKYESIKLTLLHELAHMVHSEHDANFHALNKQLNEEALSLDWTKSGGQSFGGFKSAYDDEEEDELTDAGGVFTSGGQKLGGNKEHSQLGAHSAAGLAALLRLSKNNERNENESVPSEELNVIAEGNEVGISSDSDLASKQEPDPKDQNLKDDAGRNDIPQSMEVDQLLTDRHAELGEAVEDLVQGSQLQMGSMEHEQEIRDPLNHSSDCKGDVFAGTGLKFADAKPNKSYEATYEDGEGLGGVVASLAGTSQLDRANGTLEHIEEDTERSLMEEDPSLKSLQESTELVCQRVQKAIFKLKAEASPSEAAASLQSLYKILRNLMEHPHEEKYKRLRKANAVFQNRIARFEGAVEILQAVGFREEPGSENSADYLILKRNDPVLLWLAQSSLEATMA